MNTPLVTGHPSLVTLNAFSGKRILVIGDLMLDHYVWGEVKRISPEAPVPVLEAEKEEYRPGGAANVALNLKSLGAEPLLLGLIGADSAGEILQEALLSRGITASYLVRSPQRKTCLKTRMNAAGQQILRIDYEDSSVLSTDEESLCLQALNRALTEAEAVIIEDYNKGLLSPAFIGSVLQYCSLKALPVAVDPKYHNFFSYKAVDIFKPNYSELLARLENAPLTEEEFLASAEAFRQKQGIKHLVVTRGAKGLIIFSPDSAPVQLPTYAREVFDVTGAGDTVISVLALAYVCGTDILEAARLANHAAGVVCGKKGTATANLQEIVDSIVRQETKDAQS
ncbi:MAG: D-glycero-beta-D-manno-heptose-7-phosphate kinase [Candidatus Cloacimonadota bacterium]